MSKKRAIQQVWEEPCLCVPTYRFCLYTACHRLVPPTTHSLHLTAGLYPNPQLLLCEICTINSLVFYPHLWISLWTKPWDMQEAWDVRNIDCVSCSWQRYSKSLVTQLNVMVPQSFTTKQLQVTKLSYDWTLYRYNLYLYSVLKITIFVNFPFNTFSNVQHISSFSMIISHKLYPRKVLWSLAGLKVTCLLLPVNIVYTVNCLCRCFPTVIAQHHG